MDIAVLGVGCRLPGSKDAAAYWDLLLRGGIAIDEIPESRVDHGLLFAPERGNLGRTSTRIGGIVPELPFDYDACPVDPALIEQADPSHAIALQVAAAAFLDAGYDRSRLDGRKVGVYVGQSRGSTLVADLICAGRAGDLGPLVEGISDFGGWTEDVRSRAADDLVDGVRAALPRRSADFNPDLTASAAPRLIASAFGLRGPCLALDAACASGLYTVAAAVSALRSGRIEMALAGAASFNSWMSLVLFSQAQALTANGSFPFDERADGFVSSDGYGAVVLKPVSAAQGDGDPILAVIRGVGLATDGHGRSLWAPRKEGQVAAMRRAYADPSLLERVQFIEAHGTSTQLGDATEIESVTEVFAAAAGERRIPLASVKGNIGHTCETAGIAGLIKTVLSIRHATIPPAVNFVRPNRQIDWDKAPIRIPTSAEEWAASDEHPRVAAINSFGIGGLNAHVVVEEPRRLEARPRGGARVVPVAAAPKEPDRRLAIVGIGAVFPGAFTVDAFSRAIREGRPQTKPIPRERWDGSRTPGALPVAGPTAIAGLADGFAYDWRRHKLPPRQLETGDPLRFMLLDAAEQALAQAGVKGRSDRRERTAVVVGTMLAGDFYSDLSFALRLPHFERLLRENLSGTPLQAGDAEEVVEEFRASFLARNRALQDETGGFSSSTLASSIAKTFDLMGGAVTVDGAEASSLAALDLARDLLADGACDAVLCAGGQRYLGLDSHEWYGLRGLLASDAAGTDGMRLAEGAGALVVKRLADARSESDRILAVVDGIAFGAEPGHSGGAIRAAVEASVSERAPGERPVRLRAVGAGAPRLEAMELGALAQVRSPGARTEASAQSASPARQFGFALGASGMASLIGEVLDIQRTGAAGVLSFALDGPAYHAVLSDALLPAAASARLVSASRFRIHRLSAPSSSDLAAKAAALAREAGAPRGENRYEPGHEWRMAIVADTDLALSEKLLLAARAIGEEGALDGARSAAFEEQGLYIGRALKRPRVAFAFSGQGSQYQGMLGALLDECPAALRRMEEFDAVLAGLGHPPVREIFALSDERLGSDVWATQMSLLAAETILHAAIVELDIWPDVVFGHSFGEYVALTAAESWSLEQAIRVTDARARFILADTGRGGIFLATNADAARIEPLLAGLPGFAAIAIRNAPDRSVVGGETEAIAELGKRLTANGFSMTILPVPRAFHTSLMQGVREPMRDFLQEQSMHPPAVPLLSSVTASFVADPDQIRENLVHQLTRPMTYFDVVGRLIRDGVDAVVEVGPRQILTGLHRRQLPTDGSICAVASDNPKRPGLQQLLRVRARLETIGWNASERRAEDRAASPATSSPAIMVERHPIVRFDATERRRQKRSEEGKTREALPLAAAPEPGTTDPWQDFVVTFICENTGYPRDLVDLDADLEADLGIDSLKKAQLFGELQERFQLPLPTGGRLSLNDYPTPRHILSFLREHAGSDLAAAPPSAPAASPRPTPRPRLVADHPALPVLALSGSPKEMGRTHGRLQAETLNPLLDRLLALPDGGIAPDFDPRKWFSAAGLDELEGMAEALGRPLDDLVALNLMIVRRNVRSAAPARLESVACAQAAIVASRNQSAMLLHAANEDWPFAMTLGNDLPRIVQVRRPEGAIPHLAFGVPGELGGVNGMNSEGLAVTSANLLDAGEEETDGATGVFHPELVMRILANATDPESAADIVRASGRSGAWSLCVSHAPSDSVFQIEYDEHSVEVVRRDVVRTANHACLVATAGDAPEHSKLREARLGELLEDGEAADWSVDKVCGALRDTHDLRRGRTVAHPTLNTVKRQDNQISIVMRPATFDVWVTRGPRSPQPDEFIHLDAGPMLRPQAPEPERDGKVMARWVLRPRPAPLPKAARDGTPVWKGAALVLGDGAPADRLKRRIADAGGRVFELPDDLPENDIAQVVAALHAESPLAHLFVAAPSGARRAPGTGEWNVPRIAMMRTYLACQKWCAIIGEEGSEEEATLLALTSLGGDFGLSGRSPHLEGGALSGLLKAVRREYPSMLVKQVDFPADETPDAAARIALAELASLTRELEVGYFRGRRQVVKAVPRRLPPDPGPGPEPGVWVVSGGAGGITALVAKELGRRCGLTLHILGRTPAEPDASGDPVPSPRTRPGGETSSSDRRAAIRRFLDELAVMGVEAHYHCCDVGDRAACEAALRSVREISGPIHGVIHGAGIEQAASFARKRPEMVEATLAAKNDGAANLMALTEADPLRWFVAFGSISGRFGGLGQTDYAMASDLLAKQVLRYRARRPACRSFVVDWPAWDEAGMSVRPETRVALRGAGFSFMSPSEGIEHLIDELRAGGGEGEVMFLDDDRGIDLDGIMPQATERASFARAAPAAASMPLLEGIRSEDGGNGGIEAETRLDPASDPFLRDHRFDGAPLMPAVIGMEAMAEAARLHFDGPAELRDLEILAAVKPVSATELVLRTTPTGRDGGVACELRGEFFNRRGILMQTDRVFMRATCAPLGTLARADGFEDPELPGDAPWVDWRYPDESAARRERTVSHGATFHALEALRLGKGGGHGRITAPDPQAPGGGRQGRWLLPVAVLDACLVACAVHARTHLGRSQLPVGFGSVRCWDMPVAGEACRLVFRHLGTTDETTTYDFAVKGENGRPLLDVGGHRAAAVNLSSA